MQVKNITYEMKQLTKEFTSRELENDLIISACIFYLNRTKDK